MTYNPVSNVTMSAEFMREAQEYAILYQVQHEKHVRYSWILWITVAAVILGFSAFRLVKLLVPRAAESMEQKLSQRNLFRWTLSISRAQFILIAAYTVYNIVLSLVDIPYGTGHHYASRHSPGFVQEATSLQFIANRTGYLAFASMPLVLLLVTRYSLVTLFTGISYKSLNLLHRWVGYTVFLLSWIHTILWTIEMALHCHNKNGFWVTRWEQRYWLGGFFASLFMSWLVLHALPAVRRYTGYEFFRITHNLGTILLLVGCWVHWPEESRWLAPCVALYYADRFARWFIIAYHSFRCKGKSALIGKVYTDEDNVSVAVVSIVNSGLRQWKAGEHLYIYCISLGEWEPHPFSVANTSTAGQDVKLIIRQRSGLTRELVDRLYERTNEPVKVLIDGPYGSLDTQFVTHRPLLIVVGGTGISFALSTLWLLTSVKNPSIKLIWYIRRRGNIEWVKQDLEDLQRKLKYSLLIDIRVTRENVLLDEKLLDAEHSMEISESSSSETMTEGASMSIRFRAPQDTLVSDIETFYDQQSQPCTVMGCGPGKMSQMLVQGIQQLRTTKKADIRFYMEQYNV